MGEDIDVKALLERVCDAPFADIDTFVSEVFIKVVRNHEEIVAMLQANMNKWKFSRLNRIAQSILLLSVAHYRYVGEVDRSAVIDIAVRMAKRLSLIHISEPTRLLSISYAVFCLKTKKQKQTTY